mgnify:CR=1 FL=1
MPKEPPKVKFHIWNSDVTFAATKNDLLPANRSVSGLEIKANAYSDGKKLYMVLESSIVLGEFGRKEAEELIEFLKTNYCQEGRAY